MSITIDAAGISIQTYDEILEEIIVAIAAALALTAEQTERVRSTVKSTLGNMSRVEAEREAALQEAILEVSRTLSWDSEGAALDGVVALLGVERVAALTSTVTGPAVGTPGTIIVDGHRVQYDADGLIWVVTGGPYTIPGGGSIDVTVEHLAGVAAEPSLDPDAGFDGWTILDTLTGWSDVGTFETTTQSVVGALVESDAATRARGAIEAYRRGQGPLAAIEAAVTAVTGVTFVRAFENTGDPNVTDANGIPGRAIAVVVEGGSDADVVAAILTSRPGGMLLVGTDIVSVENLGGGKVVTIRADRVTDTSIWITADAVTSTSEEIAPVDVTDVIAARLLEQGPILFGIGDDVTPYKLATSCADIPGFDDLTVTLSLDDGAGDPYTALKRAMAISERATFAAVRILVTES